MDSKASRRALWDARRWAPFGIVLALASVIGAGRGAAAGLAGQGQITSVTLSPASTVTPGTSVTVVVNASQGCGAIEINFGDTTVITFPVITLPLQQTHVYPNAGAYTVTVRGQGNCTGQTSTTLQVVAITPREPSASGEIHTKVSRPDVVPILAGSPQAVVGQESTYPIRVRNSNVAASDVLVRVFLPKQLDFARASGNGIDNCQASNPGNLGSIILNCNVRQIAAGAEVTLNVVVVPIRGLANGTRLDVRVQLDPFNTIQEESENNNIADGSLMVAAETDLEIANVTVERLSLGDFRLPLLTPGAVAESCAPDGTSHANTIVRVRVRNNGPGGSLGTSLSVVWSSHVHEDFFTDCVQGTHCSNGKCLLGAAAAPRAPCFNACPVPGLFPGTEAEVVFRVVRDQDVTNLGEVSIAATGGLLDTNTSNNRKTIQ